MRYVFGLVLVVSFCAAAFGGVSVSDGKMTADMNSEPLGQVIQKIQSQTGIRFSIDDQVAGQAITASFQDLPIAFGIKKMLEGTGINYAVVGEANGLPEAVFIGASEKPGAASKSPTRPAPYAPSRAVVAPVTAPPQQPQQLPSGGRARPIRPAPTVDRKPDLKADDGAAASQRPTEIPTAGGFQPNDTGSAEIKDPSPPADNADPNDEEDEEE
jgi:hypothetical protein